MKNAFLSFVWTLFFLVGAFLGLGLGWAAGVYGPYTVWRYGGLSVEERCKKIQPDMTVDQAMEIVRSGPVPTDEGFRGGTLFFSSPAGTCEIAYAQDTNKTTQVRFAKFSMK